MGSLAFAPLDADRRFGSAPAECHFRDSDGVIVSAALNLDQEGLDEVEVWKVDFSPLRKWPARAGPYRWPGLTRLMKLTATI